MELAAAKKVSDHYPVEATLAFPLPVQSGGNDKNFSDAYFVSPARNSWSLSGTAFFISLINAANAFGDNV